MNQKLGACLICAIVAYALCFVCLIAMHSEAVRTYAFWTGVVMCAGGLACVTVPLTKPNWTK